MHFSPLIQCWVKVEGWAPDHSTERLRCTVGKHIHQLRNGMSPHIAQTMRNSIVVSWATGRRQDKGMPELRGSVQNVMKLGHNKRDLSPLPEEDRPPIRYGAVKATPV